MSSPGWGGARPGSGQKKKTRAERFLGGGADKRAPKPRGVTVAAPDTVAMPEGLPAAVVALWDELAPLATAQRTLVAATSRAFVDLLRAIVLRDRMIAQIDDEGMTTTKTVLKMQADGGGEELHERKAHPLIARYQMQCAKVETGLLRFRLNAMGKEIIATEKPEDPFEEFDDGTVQ